MRLSPTKSSDPARQGSLWHIFIKICNTEGEPIQTAHTKLNILHRHQQNPNRQPSLVRSADLGHADPGNYLYLAVELHTYKKGKTSGLVMRDPMILIARIPVTAQQQGRIH
jgi:hypothetical protein